MPTYFVLHISWVYAQFRLQIGTLRFCVQGNIVGDWPTGHNDSTVPATVHNIEIDHPGVSFINAEVRS